MTMIFSIWTVVVLILFIGIVIWAWSDHNKKNFDAAARLPFDEETVSDKITEKAAETTTERAETDG